ncbi:MAG: signal peptidase II [Bdellovibrionota bacterium]
MTKAKLKRKNLIIAMILIVSLIAIDQVVKVLARAYLAGHRGHSYLGGIVQVEYAENRGAFLSLGAQLSESSRSLLFIFGAGAMLVFCAYWLWKTVEHRLSMLAFALVIAGGIGNLIDRIFRGSVTDYVHMGIGNLRTGVFNVADMAISLGFIFLIFLQYKTEKKTAS